VVVKKKDGKVNVTLKTEESNKHGPDCVRYMLEMSPRYDPPVEYSGSRLPPSSVWAIY
jgi:hypothetical protein